MKPEQKRKKLSNLSKNEKNYESSTKKKEKKYET